MKIKYTTTILLLIALMFIADSANSVLRNLGASFYRISIFIRFVAQIYFTLLLFRKRQSMWILLIMLLIYNIFLIGSMAAMDSFAGYNLAENFFMINKMLFFFICWETFRQYLRTTHERNRLFKVFEFLVLVEVSTVIVGFIFDLDIFSAYADVKFGYRGLIPAENEVSGFFIIAFFYFLWKVTNLGQGMLQLLATLVAGLLTGTRVCLALPMILLLYMGRWLIRIRIKKIHISLIIVTLLLVAIALLKRDYILSRLGPTISYYQSQTSLYFHGRSDFLVSGRSLLVGRFFSDFLPQFNFLNYLFGGQDLTHFSTETDLVDVFARLGLVGGFVFYFLYVKALTYRNTKTISFTHLLFVATWLGVSIVAGHLVFSAINGVYLAILLLAFSSGYGGHVESYSRQRLRKCSE